VGQNDRQNELQYQDVSTYLRAWYKGEKNDSPIELGDWPRIVPMVSKVGWRGHPADLFSKFSVLLGVRLPPPLLCQQLFLFCLAWKRPRKKLFLIFPH